MLSSSLQKTAGVDSKRSMTGARAPSRNIKVVPVCAATTAWDNWSTNITKARKASNTAVLENTNTYSSELAAAVSAAAKAYKPHGAAAPSGMTSFKLAHVEAGTQSLPTDLHARLEAVGQLQLKSVLGATEGKALDCAIASYTTTDVDAALSLTGTIVDQNGEKNAIVVFLATETQRQASWSRLEGLILHWACTETKGSQWNMPPNGWKASPDKSVDAGGAWQCSFEKQAQGHEPLYMLVMQLPLKGPLRSGGITFVLKATAGQNTRWLKDASSQQDFFLDLQQLPTYKA